MPAIDTASTSLFAADSESHFSMNLDHGDNEGIHAQEDSLKRSVRLQYGPRLAT